MIDFWDEVHSRCVSIKRCVPHSCCKGRDFFFYFISYNCFSVVEYRSTLFHFSTTTSFQFKYKIPSFPVPALLVILLCELCPNLPSNFLSKPLWKHPQLIKPSVAFLDISSNVTKHLFVLHSSVTDIHVKSTAFWIQYTFSQDARVSVVCSFQIKTLFVRRFITVWHVWWNVQLTILNSLMWMANHRRIFTQWGRITLVNRHRWCGDK